MTTGSEESPIIICSQDNCNNEVAPERFAAGYDYCIPCSKRFPTLRPSKAKHITLESYDVDELRRAW